MLKTRERVVNKIHELEAYALIDAKSHQQSEAAQPRCDNHDLYVKKTSRPTSSIWTFSQALLDFAMRLTGGYGRPGG